MDSKSEPRSRKLLRCYIVFEAAEMKPKTVVMNTYTDQVVWNFDPDADMLSFMDENDTIRLIIPRHSLISVEYGNA